MSSAGKKRARRPKPKVPETITLAEWCETPEGKRKIAAIEAEWAQEDRERRDRLKAAGLTGELIPFPTVSPVARDSPFRNFEPGGAA